MVHTERMLGVEMMQTQAHLFKNTERFHYDPPPLPISQSIEMVHVDAMERTKLEKIYHQSIKLTCEEIVLEIKKYAPNFTRVIKRLLKNDAPCSILISGLPVITGKTERQVINEKMSLAFAHLLGFPFQYLQQNEGKLVAEITPREGYENTQSGLGRAHFGWHTDDSIFSINHRTEWIQLLGVINEGLTETLISPIDDIVKQLPNEALRILMENRFEVKMPTSFGFRHQIWSYPLPLIWKNEQGQYEVGVPTYHVRISDQNDQPAHAALQALFSAIDICRYSVIIQAGTLFIFNNNRVLHGRTPVIGDRMVLRTYIRRDLNALREITGNHTSVFDARFLI